MTGDDQRIAASLDTIGTIVYPNRMPQYSIDDPNKAISIVRYRADTGARSLDIQMDHVERQRLLAVRATDASIALHRWANDLDTIRAEAPRNLSERARRQAAGARADRREAGLALDRLIAALPSAPPLERARHQCDRCLSLDEIPINEVRAWITEWEIYADQVNPDDLLDLNP